MPEFLSIQHPPRLLDPVTAMLRIVSQNCDCVDFSFVQPERAQEQRETVRWAREAVQLACSSDVALTAQLTDSCLLTTSIARSVYITA